MFLRKKRFEAIVSNTKLLERTVGIMMSEITVYKTAVASTNTYNSKASQVTEIHNKYKGVARYGNQLLQRIVNLRVAFSVPNRLFLRRNPSSKASESQVDKSKDFLNEFMRVNSLDSSLPRDLCKESEFEGEILVRLTWDNKLKVPRLKFYPWSLINYTIKPKQEFLVNSPLLLQYTREEGKAKKTGSSIVVDVNTEDKVVSDDEFVFLAFNDKLNSYEGYPTCGGILVTIENLDKDLKDWRNLNHLFAHPTPFFKCETKEEADAINDVIRGIGWKVGTSLAANADFKLVGPTGAEGIMLSSSISTGAKIISGHTGIGIHFLGFANVMSNRATADSMGEPTEVVLHAEITGWQGFYNILFAKAIEMRNKKLNKPIVSDAIIPKLTPLTDRQWRVVKDIFLPAAKEGLITQSTFLEKLPDVDPDAEMSKIEEEERKTEEKKKKRREEEADGREQPQYDKDGNVLPSPQKDGAGFSRVQEE